MSDLDIRLDQEMPLGWQEEDLEQLRRKQQGDLDGGRIQLPLPVPERPLYDPREQEKPEEPTGGYVIILQL